MLLQKIAIHNWLSFTRAIDRTRSIVGVVLVGLVLSFLVIAEAKAVPSYSIQTAQPCSACHVGAYGPALRQLGRDFKLYGYVANDTKDHTLPLAMLLEGSFTHTQSDQPGGAAPGFNDNDNFAWDAAAFFYAGRITESIGAFIEVEYDAIEHKWAWEDTDIRHVNELTLFGADTVIGETLNNITSIQDLWQTSPAWGFPFQSSGLAPTPTAAPLIEGGLDTNVLGLGVYALWNNLIYLELTGYSGLGHDTLRNLGSEPINGGDTLDGIAPYWRLALQHEEDAGQQYMEIGTYGLAASLFPGEDRSLGETDDYVDIGFDATYQWMAAIESTRSDFLSVHASHLIERTDLDASRVFFGTKGSNTLKTTRVEVSYSFDATFTPTIQYFRIDGTADPARWSTLTGSPDSAGWVFELAYVPWGKPDSPYQWMNARLLAQYTAYDEFDGVTSSADDNNTLFVGLSLGFAFNR